MEDRSFSLSNFYKTEKVEFIETSKIAGKTFIRTVERDLTFVTDPTALIEYLCEQRNLDMMNAMVRIGLDSGQGSLKVTMNIFDPEELDGEKLTGCNKLIILAFVKDVSECHSNIDIIHKKANLDDIKHYKACDLKLLNILLGISGHGGLHSCLYCDGLMSTPGTLRTFGSLKKDYQNFMEAGGDESKMKNFNNVIKPSIIEEQDDVFVIDTIPIPELHKYLKITTN